MRLTIERRGGIVEVDGVPCGVWNGRTAGGARCLVFVWAFAVPGDAATALEVGKAIGAGALEIDSGDPVATAVGECRAWWGHTDTEYPLCAYVRRIAVADGEDASEFEAALFGRPAPADWSAALAVIHPEAGPAAIDARKF